ncbi:CaiB/BaiF CoA transferase family protein [Anaerobacillus isosaccharinicus]|uniref:CoA transferase n=1 Tax=Anaerobacillus isosaccharinicus TaxID=1532552 RepID=A0A1S2LB84_9BACI|nr:CaiB/BaiF CoA-transferase family protein [Anaerobacillus isosaccharinicus]MBA5588118.1 CoA transferase [Anaerobacillus isosaccharinicus]QOY38425.1 CoA transferase [Anaerobacillus isosaccharinicus]
MLSGIRIIDFSQYLPGPYATMRLADKGAEVIVVEPLEGESSRHLELKSEGTSLLYLANNRNKKSIAINLKEPKGQQLALDLIKEADVVVESFRPSVMKRLGLDYETVKKIKNDIIYCSISGFGQMGQMSHLGSHDLNYLAISGVLAQLKDERGRPMVPSVQLADHLGSFNCTEEILTAMIKRSKTNEGSYIDLSLVDALVSIMGTNYMHYSEAKQYRGVPELIGEKSCYNIYETQDGRYVAFAALEEKFWTNFCKAVGKEEWIPLHKETCPFFHKEITEFFKKRTLEQWTQFSFKVDCCLTPILEINEIIDFPFLKERNLFLDEKNKGSSIASFFSQNLSGVSRPPQVGEDTEEILSSILNYSPIKIKSLINTKIVRSGVKN